MTESHLNLKQTATNDVHTNTVHACNFSLPVFVIIIPPHIVQMSKPFGIGEETFLH